MDGVDEQEDSTLDYEAEIVEALFTGQVGERSSARLAENIVYSVIDELPNENTVPYIARVRELKQILAYLPRCSEQVQHETLDILLRLLDSYRNLEICCNEGILFEIIQILTEMRFTDAQSISKLKNMASILGRHRVSIADMKKMFRIISRQKHATKVAKLSGLVLEMLRQFLLEENRFEMFDFSGTDSEKNDNEEFTQVVQITKRINIREGYSTSSHWGLAFRSIFYLLLDPSRKLFTATITHRRAVYPKSAESLIKGGTVTRQSFSDFTFETNKWYFIAIMHEKTFFSSSVIELYVNGERRSQHSLKYPKFDKPFTLGGIGLSVCSPSKNNLQGQIASLCVFNVAQSQNELNRLYEKGPNHLLELISTDMQSSIKSRLLETTFSSKKVVCYMTPKDADLLDGKIIVSPQFLKGSTLIEAPSVRDSIRGVGGIEVILPFFARLPSPSTKPTSMMLSAPSLVIFLSDLLQENTSLLSSLTDNPKPFSVMAWLLERADEAHKTIGLIRSFEKLLTSVSGNEKIERSIFEAFFFNFDIWSTSTFDVQLELIETLIRQHKKSHQFPIPVTVVRILNILRTYYFYDAEAQTGPSNTQDTSNTGMKRNDSFMKMTMLRMESRKISSDQIAQLRGKLLDLSLLICVDKGVTEFTVKNILYHIENTCDYFQQQDLLSWLLKLLHRSPPLNGLSEALQSVDPSPTISTLVGSRNESVRLFTLRFLSTALSKGIIKPKSAYIEALYTVLFDQLQNFPFNHGTYQVLNDIMVGMDNVHSKQSENGAMLKDPLIVPHIFHLVALSDDTKLVILILQDLKRLLERSPQNLATWCAISGWQKLLLDVYARVYVLDPTCKEIEQAADCVSYIFFLEFMMFKHDHRGWTAAIKNMIGYCDLLDKEVDSTKIMRGVARFVLPSLSEDLKMFHIGNTYELIAWSNLVHICWVIEDIAFYSMEKTEDSFLIFPVSDRDERGVWMDYDLINHALDIFFPLLVSEHEFSVIEQKIELEKRFTTNKGGIGRLLLRFILTTLTEQEIYFDKIMQSPTTNMERLEAFEFNLQRFDLVMNKYQLNSKELEACFYLSVVVHTVQVTQRLENTTPYMKLFVGIVEKYKHKIFSVLKEYLPQSLKTLYSTEVRGDGQVEMEDIDQTPESIFKTWSDSEVVEQIQKVIDVYMDDWNKLHQEIGEKLLASRSSYCRNVMSLKVSKDHEARKSLELQHYEKWQVVLDNRKKFLIEENQRYRNFRHDLRRRKGEAERYWKHAMKSLTDECGPWYNPPSDVPDKFYILLDTEDGMRRRFIFKINKEGTRHMEAVYHLSLSRSTKQIQPPFGLEKEANAEPVLLQSQTNESIITEEDEEITFPVLTEEPGIHVFEEEVLFCFPCRWIYPLNDIQGEISFTRNTMSFISLGSADGDSGSNSSSRSSTLSRTIPVTAERLTSIQHSLSSITRAEKRRYMLRNNSLELFIQDFENPTMFLTFDKSDRSRVLKVLGKLCPNIDLTDPSSSSSLQVLTSKWQRKEISNFEYLMKLNTAAGRTYSDLTQYPVFPWILTDYKSKRLDLTNPSVYRDLSKPIGALEPTRLAKYLERYQSFDGADTPPYMYSGHYSSTYSVAFFMLRVEPFTKYFLNLQDGRFDVPDRLFHSLEDTWNNCLQSSTDVKELIPEMFYLPDMFVNRNQYDLGIRQDEAHVNDVVLPPWAQTPEEFVRIHREALESDYVSQHLHEWIDLIFGYKQTGNEAVEAHNVFHYLSYEGVDLDLITDPLQRKSAEVFINLCGQTPKQLFRKPHPPRFGVANTAAAVVTNMQVNSGTNIPFSPPPANRPSRLGSNSMPLSPASSLLLRDCTPKRYILHGTKTTSCGVSHIGIHGDNIYTLDRYGLAGIHTWTVPSSGSSTTPSGNSLASSGSTAGYGGAATGGFTLSRSLSGLSGVLSPRERQRDYDPDREREKEQVREREAQATVLVVDRNPAVLGPISVGLVCGGRWIVGARGDGCGRIRIHDLDGRCVSSIGGFQGGSVRCMSLFRLDSTALGSISSSGNITTSSGTSGTLKEGLLTGADDGTIAVWVGMRFYRRLLGHSAPVTHVAALPSLPLVVSVGADGVVLVHYLHGPRLWAWVVNPLVSDIAPKSIFQMGLSAESAKISHLALTPAPHIVLAVETTQGLKPVCHLALASLDGRCLQVTSTLHPVTAIVVANRYPVLVSIEGTKVIFRAIADLSVLQIHDYDNDSSIYSQPPSSVNQLRRRFTCACFDHEEYRLILGAEDESVLVLPVDLAVLSRLRSDFDIM